MSIKDFFYSVEYNEINFKIITDIKKKIVKLSHQDEKMLLSIIGKFKEQDINITLKAIKVLSIWKADTAIIEARKKGVFRYKAYELKDNKALYLLNNLIECSDLFNFSNEINNYLIMKKKLAWFFDFYKHSENKLKEYIIKRHSDRLKIKRGQGISEDALFKDLLAYIDLTFYKDKINSKLPFNKNSISGYSKEEICDAISYIIFLYDKEIGIKQDINYIIDSKYVLGSEIEKVILIACKLIQIQEWELCIDYLDYKVEFCGNEIKIFDPTNTLEKSIRMGYVNQVIQNFLSYERTVNNDINCFSASNWANLLIEKLGDRILKYIDDGNLSRFRFEYPKPIFEAFKNIEGFFQEEIMILEYFSKELMLESKELIDKPITEHCTFVDILLFQRFFIFTNLITEKMLIEKKLKSNKNKVVFSLVPTFKKDILANAIENFIEPVKVKELMELFTYKKNYKLDLQYTPFLNASGNLTFSNMIVAKSNLIRNAIAYSYMSKNEIANDDQGLEPLVKLCSDFFKKAGYLVLENKNFKYNGHHGEVDVIVIHDSDIILIECKSPLSPVNNFEMRSSIDHINKANKQLNLSKEAFTNKNFIKNFCKQNSIEYKERNIKTCIIFGNRLLCGYKKSKHPIRYIYELGMVLEKGLINSTVGSWRIWNDDVYNHQDLLKFLSDENCFINYVFDSMHKYTEKISGKGKKVVFETYAFNAITCCSIFDDKFKIVDKNEEVRESIKTEFKIRGIDIKL